MTDYAPNWTPRIRVSYSVHGNDHDFLVRMARDEGSADLADYISKIEAWLAAQEAHFYTDWTVTGAAFAEVDSDIFLPVTAPGSPTGAISTSGRPGSQKALGLTYTGRGATGSKWKLTLFGTGNLVAASSGDDWTLTTAESAPVAAAIVAHTELPPIFKAIDGSAVSPYPRARLKYFDHWVDNARS